MPGKSQILFEPGSKELSLRSIFLVILFIVLKFWSAFMFCIRFSRVLPAFGLFSNRLIRQMMYTENGLSIDFEQFVRFDSYICCQKEGGLMLEYARTDTINAIEGTSKAIEKNEKKLNEYRHNLDQERSFFQKWLRYFQIQHTISTINTKKAALRDLALNLQSIDEAMESQHRDNEILRHNERLPFPKELAEQLTEIDQVSTKLPETDWGSGLVCTINSIVAKTGNALFKPKNDSNSKATQNSSDN